MRNGISQVLLYPLRFEPIYQYRLWGGRRLGDLLTAPLPSGPGGEAWILSDRDDHPSRVAELCYSAGVMVLSKQHPQVIRYRCTEPVLTPALPQERHGIIANAVFPTGIDRRDDLGSPNRFDVYYGMADYRIGVARLDVPNFLPSEGVADPAEAKS